MRTLISKLLIAAVLFGSVLALLPSVSSAADQPAAPAATAPAAAAPAAAAPAAPQMKVDKGDTTWMMISTILVLLMTVPGLALYRTDRDGRVVVESDGTSASVRTDR